MLRSTPVKPRPQCRFHFLVYLPFIPSVNPSTQFTSSTTFTLSPRVLQGFTQTRQESQHKNHQQVVEEGLSFIGYEAKHVPCENAKHWPVKG